MWRRGGYQSGYPFYQLLTIYIFLGLGLNGVSVRNRKNIKRQKLARPETKDNNNSKINELTIK